MGHGLETRGKHFNSSSPDEINRGVYGKLNAAQTDERLELHAKRLHGGAPTLQGICDHFNVEYGITIHIQSEKEWALRDKNRAAILARQEQMIKDGELEITTLSKQTLLNSLSEAARSEAFLVRSLKAKVGGAIKNFDADFKPWNVIGCTKTEYLTATKEQMKEWKPRVDIELKIKKEVLGALRDLSKVMKDHSEEVRLTVAQAFSMNDKMASSDAASEKAYKVRQKKKELKKAQDDKVLGSEPTDFKEVDMEALRESVA